MDNQTTQAASASSASLHPDTGLGLVALTVRDLPGSLEFYTDVMGFQVIEEGRGRVVLGAAGKPLLELHEDTEAHPFSRSATGLYHFAVLLPTRKDLGRWLLHLAESGYPLGGASDHLVSEALYLSDPEDNGIEVYRDRQREEWPRVNGVLQMATDPLDLRALIDEARNEPQPWNGLPEGTKLGHMHLQVADIPKARDFYHGVLGFDIMFDMEKMGALFVSAGGYHHHLGLNTWHSRGRGPGPEGSAGLRYFTVLLPDALSLSEVLGRLESAGIAYKQEQGGIVVGDPWRNKILFLTRQAE
jgi:catechol 2,3-dioxygenase